MTPYHILGACITLLCRVPSTSAFLFNAALVSSWGVSFRTGRERNLNVNRSGSTFWLSY